MGLITLLQVRNEIEEPNAINEPMDYIQENDTILRDSEEQIKMDPLTTKEDSELSKITTQEPHLTDNFESMDTSNALEPSHSVECDSEKLELDLHSSVNRGEVNSEDRVVDSAGQKSEASGTIENIQNVLSPHAEDTSPLIEDRKCVDSHQETVQEQHIEEQFCDELQVDEDTLHDKSETDVIYEAKSEVEKQFERKSPSTKHSQENSSEKDQNEQENAIECHNLPQKLDTTMADVEPEKILAEMVADVQEIENKDDCESIEVVANEISHQLVVSFEKVVENVYKEDCSSNSREQDAPTEDIPCNVIDDENSQSQESQVSQSSQSQCSSTEALNTPANEATKIAILDDWEDSDDSEFSDEDHRKIVHRLINDWNDEEEEGK